MPPDYPLHWRRKLLALIGLIVLLVIVVIFAITLGSAHIPFTTTYQVLLSKLPFIYLAPTWSENIETIILDIRLPRIILAGMVGAALAVAGATYQCLFRNPLADPYLIGVAQGAGLGATIGFLLPFSGAFGFGSIPLLAFLGAISAVMVIYSVARTGKILPMTTLILAGVALGAFLCSITSYLMVVAGEELHGIVFWLLGGFSLADWNEVKVVLPLVVIGTVIIWLHARPLNVMMLDEEQAQQLGVDVERVKLILVLAATLATAAAVSFAGLIGFVGILIPHAVRLVLGPDHRFLLPFSTVAGGIFLILADSLAHSIIPPGEIPVGVITAFLGAPFFLYLLRQRKRAIF